MTPFINVADLATAQTPLYSAYKSCTKRALFGFAATIVAKSSHMRVLFILQLSFRISNAGQLKTNHMSKQANFDSIKLVATKYICLMQRLYTDYSCPYFEVISDVYLTKSILFGAPR